MTLNPLQPIRTSILIVLLISLAACAQQFPRPVNPPPDSDDPSAAEIFARTFDAHGGERLDEFDDLIVALDGKWKFLITRIQPLVTDHKYRVESEERLLPQSGVYTASYRGPDGTKQVIRTPDSVRVFYNGEESFDDDVLQSTALTADAFFLFTIGPLALWESRDDFQRLDDGVDKGKRYFRLYAVLEPGFGYADRDEIVLWVDPETFLTYRVHITLEGYETTKGAHVDVTFLDYEKRGDFVLPSRYLERVLGPIRITAHRWQLTGLDINRGFSLADIEGPVYVGRAADPAKQLP